MHAPSTHASLLARLSRDEHGNGPDHEAWLEFEHRYGPLIRDYGRRRGLQSSDCDDLLQNVLLSLTKAMPAFRYDPDKGRLRSYLKTVTIRSLSRSRRQDEPSTSLEDVGDPAADADDPWEQAWRQHHVRRALATLGREFPERTITAFSLYVLEGREAAETAELLGMSIDSVYQAKTRVLRRVEELVGASVAQEG